MTVAELIKELQQLPPEPEVYYFDRHEDPVGIDHVYTEDLWEDEDGNKSLDQDEEHPNPVKVCGLSY